MVATLMALFFGLFSMPATQAAPGNGPALGNAANTLLPLEKAQWRRRRRCRHHWRSRVRCWWW